MVILLEINKTNKTARNTIGISLEIQSKRPGNTILKIVLPIVLGGYLFLKIKKSIYIIKTKK